VTELYDPAAVSEAFDLINRWLQWTTPNIPAERERTVSRAAEITQVLANGGVLRRPERESDTYKHFQQKVIQLRDEGLRLREEKAEYVGVNNDLRDECDRLDEDRAKMRVTILDLRTALGNERDAYNECDAARRRLARALSVEIEQHRSLREATAVQPLTPMPAPIPPGEEFTREDTLALRRALAKLNQGLVPCGKEGFNGHHLCTRGSTGSHTCVLTEHGVNGDDDYVHECQCGYTWGEA
jgi:hypothetical protein